MKKLYTLLLIFTLSLALIGCTTEAATNEIPVDNANTTNEAEVNTSDEENPEANLTDYSNETTEERLNVVDTEEDSNVPEEEVTEESQDDGIEEEYDVTLHFPTQDYIDNGNEDNKMGTETTKIFATTDNIAEKAIDKLMEGPADDKLTNGIPESVKITTVETKEAIVYVNMAEEGLNGGSLDEESTINQIVNTLMSIDGIKGVKFLINGNDGESLMGHYDISEIMTEGV